MGPTTSRVTIAVELDQDLIDGDDETLHDRDDRNASTEHDDDDRQQQVYEEEPPPPVQVKENTAAAVSSTTGTAIPGRYCAHECGCSKIPATETMMQRNAPEGTFLNGLESGWLSPKLSLLRSGMYKRLTGVYPFQGKSTTDEEVDDNDIAEMERILKPLVRDLDPSHPWVANGNEVGALAFRKGFSEERFNGETCSNGEVAPFIIECSSSSSSEESESESENEGNDSECHDSNDTEGSEVKGRHEWVKVNIRGSGSGAVDMEDVEDV